MNVKIEDYSNLKDHYKNTIPENLKDLKAITEYEALYEDSSL